MFCDTTPLTGYCFFYIMARPVKNYCDYFPHDRDMRNHRKVKALRTKFGINGYAIWSMVLEYLTGIDGNIFEYSDIEFELMGGDFGVSATEIRQVVDYCITLEMIFLKNGFINSESLDENLKPVYDKRGISKKISSKQLRVNGKFSSNNTVTNGVSVTEMPQIIVDNSKLNESKLIAYETFVEKILNPDSFPTWREECSKFLKDDYFKKAFCKSKNIPIANLEFYMKEFLVDVNIRGLFKDVAGLKNHFKNYYPKHFEGKQVGLSVSNGFVDVPENQDYEDMEKW